MTVGTPGTADTAGDAAAEGVPVRRKIAVYGADIVAVAGWAVAGLLLLFLAIDGRADVPPTILSNAALIVITGLLIVATLYALNKRMAGRGLEDFFARMARRDRAAAGIEQRVTAQIADLRHDATTRLDALADRVDLLVAMREPTVPLRPIGVIRMAPPVQPLAGTGPRVVEGAVVKRPAQQARGESRRNRQRRTGGDGGPTGDTDRRAVGLVDDQPRRPTVDSTTPYLADMADAIDLGRRLEREEAKRRGDGMAEGSDLGTG